VARIVEARRASDLYHLLATTSDEARLIAWLGLEDESGRAQLLRFQRDLHDVTPKIDGTYLKEVLHLPPGPIYRRIIDALRRARLDGLVDTLDEERAMVEDLVAREKS
jgi:tRNA nucleotidyltransferase (CCA-adding enzyme)